MKFAYYFGGEIPPERVRANGNLWGNKMLLNGQDMTQEIKKNWGTYISQI